MYFTHIRINIFIFGRQSRYTIMQVSVVWLTAARRKIFNLLDSCHLNRCLVVRGYHDVNRCFPPWETFKLFEVYCRFKYSIHSVKMRTALLKNWVGVKSFPGNSTLDVFFVDFFRFLFYLFITIMHNLYFYWKTLCKCSFRRTVVIEQLQYTHTQQRRQNS